MRAFIAVRCPGEIRRQLAVIQREIGGMGDLRMVSPENIHLTLKFLGVVADEKVPKVVEAMRGIEMRSFDVSVKGIGAFPGPKSPRVLWAGVEKGSDELNALHRRIDAVMKEYCFPPEELFACHYTIARVKYLKDGNGLAKVMEKYGNKVFGTFKAGGMDLMESTLTHSGPVYACRESFSFMP